MELELRIGYDGPTRLWLDDQELITDMNGTNPAIQDSQRRTVRVGAGEHTMTVLMALNGGKAYGFSAARAAWGSAKRSWTAPASPCRPCARPSAPDGGGGPPGGHLISQLPRRTGISADRTASYGR